MAPVRICVPKRIRARWVKRHKLKLAQQDRCKYDVTSSLKKAKVCAEEFKKCWFHVRSYVYPKLSDDELFCLFKDFGVSSRGHDITGRLTFIRNVLQQYKDAKVFSVSASIVYVCEFACVRTIYARLHALYATFTYTTHALKE